MTYALLAIVILIITTPAWFAFAIASAWRRQWQQAGYEVLIGFVCSALLSSMVAHYIPAS